MEKLWEKPIHLKEDSCHFLRCIHIINTKASVWKRNGPKTVSYLLGLVDNEQIRKE